MQLKRENDLKPEKCQKMQKESFNLHHYFYSKEYFDVFGYCTNRETFLTTSKAEQVKSFSLHTKPSWYYIL